MKDARGFLCVLRVTPFHARMIWRSKYFEHDDRDDEVDEPDRVLYEVSRY